MRHPKFEKLISYGFDQREFPATDKSGVLMGGSKDHTITILWFTDPVPGVMKSEEEYRNMKQRLILEVPKWGKDEKDFKRDPMTWRTSPMAHRVFFQTWSYKNATDRVYGITSVWYCKQSRRIFQFEILNTASNNDPFMREYLDYFKCHK